MGKLLLYFAVLWSIIFMYRWLHRWRKFLTSWCSQEIIPLCLQYIFLLCWKYRLYITGSSQLSNLCFRLVPRSGSMRDFYWNFHALWPWCLVVPEVFLKSNFPPIIACTEICGLSLEGLSMFNMICAWYRSLPHICIGYFLLVTLRKTILPCPDSPLWPISSVHIRRCQLVAYLVISVKVFKWFVGLIV